MENFTARGYFKKLKIGDMFFKKLINAVSGGNNTLMQNLIVEKMVSDDSWIKHIEDLLFSVEQVVKNPKKSIIDNTEIVQIEKAKKISSQSIRHLSSHSNFIRSIDDDGTVHPSKILTTIMDEDIMIYENRFIFTLIKRLLTFLEQKREYLSSFAEKSQRVKVNFSSDFNYNELEVGYDLKFDIKRPIKDEETINLEKTIEKIVLLKKRVFILTGSSFYKELSKANPLTPPINKTNIINMNVDYNNSYKLWLYISSFVKTGYSVKVSEKEIPAERDYYDDLTYLVVTSFKTLYENNILGYIPEEDYEDKIEKDFYLEQDINYIPDFKRQKVENGSLTDYLNLYYYEKIKDILKEEEEKEENNIEIKKDIAYSFSGFYKKLAEVNNKMFEELLVFDKPLFDIKDKEKKIKEQLKYQKEIYRRNHLLTNLKKIDYQRTLRKDASLINKIKKLELKLQEAKNDKKPKIKSVNKKNKTKNQIIEDIIKSDKIISEEILIAEKEDTQNKE